jgi:hypothetical protein
MKGLIGYTLEARDGEIGRCQDFLFDDQYWTVRYMVADTRRWLPGRKVLISPISFDKPDWETQLFPVRLTQTQIKEAPDLDENAPVSRQYERSYHRYYGWPPYWAGDGLWGTAGHPGGLYGATAPEPVREVSERESADPHLRSAEEVRGYHIQATDHEIGHVEDYIVDDVSWSIRYMVVDTRNWLPGKKVIISPSWIGFVDWGNRSVEVLLTREEVKESPEYDPLTPVNREYEVRLYDFYGRPKYWS